MFWKKKKIKIDSEEYIELKTYLDKIRLQVSSLELDLQLYIRKLKASKGLSKEQKEDETENINKSPILPI